jgi:microcystin degradation protein MlrC
VVLCDCGDNPGAGARGNTVHVLRTLLDHRPVIRGAVVGCLPDAELAAEAVAAGEGAEIADAAFNSAEPGASLSGQLSARVRVLRISHDGVFTGTRGMACGTRTSFGPCALLQVFSECGSAAVIVAVITQRIQVLSTDYFAFFGLDVHGRVVTPACQISYMDREE